MPSADKQDIRCDLIIESKPRANTYNGDEVDVDLTLATTDYNQYNCLSDTEDCLSNVITKKPEVKESHQKVTNYTRTHLHRSRSLTELKYRRANVGTLVGQIKSSTSTMGQSKTTTVSAVPESVYSDDEDGSEQCWWSAEIPSKIPSSSNTDSPTTKVATGFFSYNRQQKCTLLCLALIHFGVYLSMSIIAPFFPIEAELKGMSLSVTGWIFSSYAFVMFIVSPFMGKIIAALGVKFTLVSGLFLASGCNILFGALNFIDDETIFTTFCFLLRSVEAVGATAFFTAAWTIIAETFPDDISYVFGIMETFVGIGMTAGPAIGGALYSAGGYELPFYSLGAFMMATVPVCMYILPDPSIKSGLEDQSSIRSLIKLYKLPGMLTVFMAVTVLCGIWGFLDPTLEPHLRDFGVTPQTAGFLFLFMAATYGITCPIVGRISDKWGCELTMMFLGLILTAVCLVMMGPSILLPFIPSELRWNVLSLILLGSTIGIGTIPTFQLMLDEAHKGGFEENPTTYGMVSSIFSAASSLGEFLGPAVGGVLFEHYSFDMACTSIGIVSVATASILVISTVSSKCKLSFSKSGRKWSATTLCWNGNANKLNRPSMSDSGVYDNSNERTPLLSNSNV